MQELEKIKKAYPNRKVGLVGFSNKVVLLGDACNNNINKKQNNNKFIEYEGKILDNYNQLLEKT